MKMAAQMMQGMDDETLRQGLSSMGMGGMDPSIMKQFAAQMGGGRPPSYQPPPQQPKRQQSPPVKPPAPPKQEEPPKVR